MMVWEKDKLTPQDIADYMLYEDVTHKREIEILSDLFNNHNDMIIQNYRNDYLKLKQQVFTFMNIYELSNDEYSEAEQILRETADVKELYSYDEADCFGEYFKFIWLQLMYSGISCRKMKLRNLLKAFGYKRRSKKLINCIQQAIDNLNLKVYLRDHMPCNIYDIDIGDIIIIRLIAESSFGR